MKIMAVTLVQIAVLSLLGNLNAQKSGDVDNNEIGKNILDTWEAPEELKKNYPYYFAGYDKEGRPTWIFELGKWDFKKIVDGGEVKTMEFDTYYDQSLFRVNQSIIRNDRTKGNKDALGWVCIDDLENFSSAQLTSLPTLSYLRKLAGKFDVGTRNMDYAIMINLNNFAERLVNLLKPILGPMIGRSEIYGTNKAKWLPALLDRVPKYSLPEKYGGYANFTPIET